MPVTSTFTKNRDDDPSAPGRPGVRHRRHAGEMGKARDAKLFALSSRAAIRGRTIPRRMEVTKKRSPNCAKKNNSRRMQFLESKRRSLCVTPMGNWSRRFNSART
jgi:hypothetical protein